VNYAAYFEPGSDDDPEEFSDASVPEDAASSDDFEPSPPVSRKVSDLNVRRNPAARLTETRCASQEPDHCSCLRPDASGGNLTARSPASPVFVLLSFFFFFFFLCFFAFSLFSPGQPCGRLALQSSGGRRAAARGAKYGLAEPVKKKERKKTKRKEKKRKKKKKVI
jgi:hypothetical protein